MARRTQALFEEPSERKPSGRSRKRAERGSMESPVKARGAPPDAPLTPHAGSLIRHGSLESEAHARGETIKSQWKKVGARRGGAKGIWFQGKWLLQAGFSPGDMVAVQYDKAAGTITIAINEAGERLLTVSQRDGVPIIDVSNVDVADVVGSTEMVHFETVYGRITITREESAIMVAERTRERNNLEGSVFSGAGFLTLAAEQAGYVPTTAVEIDPVCAAVYQTNHPSANLYGNVLDLTAKIARGKVSLPHVDLVTAGIPCQNYSVITRGAVADREANVLDAMTHAYLNIAMAQNPFNIVIEQVKDYVKTETFRGLVSFLTFLGYQVQYAVLDANDFGLPTGRERAVIVATTLPAPGLLERVASSFQRLIPPTAGDILLPPSAVERLHSCQGGWFTIRTQEELDVMPREVLREEESASGWKARPGHWLGKEWARSHHPPQFITYDTKRIPAIVKGYAKPTQTGPFVKHPDRPNTYRLLTVEEIKRCHGVPDDYRLTGDYKTDVELLGQGVVVDVFRAVIEALPGGSRIKRNPVDAFSAGITSMLRAVGG